MLPANTARREVGNRTGDWRPEAGREIVDGVGVGRRVPESLGRGLLNSGTTGAEENASPAVGLRVNRPKTMVGFLLYSRARDYRYNWYGRMEVNESFEDVIIVWLWCVVEVCHVHDSPREVHATSLQRRTNTTLASSSMVHRIPRWKQITGTTSYDSHLHASGRLRENRAVLSGK